MLNCYDCRQLAPLSNLLSVAGLGLEAIDEVDYVEEAAAGTGSDAASGDGNGQMSFAGAGAANQHDVVGR
jgi:hypothetical protein